MKMTTSPMEDARPFILSTNDPQMLVCQIVDAAVMSLNGPDDPNAAGFIAALEAVLSDEEMDAEDILREALAEDDFVRRNFKSTNGPARFETHEAITRR